MKSLSVLVCLLALVVTVRAQVPNLVSYQGLLTLSSGTPASDGNYDLKFELFNVPSGGSSLWTETQTGVPLKHGTFTVNLGSVAALPALFNQQLYVQVTALAGPSVSGTTVFPRTMLTSSPYSLSLHLPFAGSSSLAASSPVFAVGNSGAGIGIEGSHDSTAGTDPGVLGQTNSTTSSAIAMEGLVTSTSPGGFSTAVRGINNGTSGLGIGVYGSQAGGGWGVYGYTPSGLGVYGYSTSGVGVYGLSYSASGAIATSTSGVGLSASSTSNYGMYGYSQTSIGAYGFSHLGTGVYGWSDSSVGVWGYTPYGVAAMVSWGDFYVIGSGDNSVQLPNDAVNSQEILDEPGIAASYIPAFFSITATLTTYRVDSVVVTAPSSGKFVVQATGYVNFDHTQGTTDNFQFNVSSTPNGALITNGVSTFLVPDSLPSRSGALAYRYPFSCMQVFNAPSAGSYTFYLLAMEYSGNTVSTDVGFTSLVATYYPTIYGNTPVAQTPASPSPEGTTVASTSTQPAQYETVQQFNDAKSVVLQRTVDQLQARIQKLESMMQQAKSTTTTSRQQQQLTPNQ